MAFIEYLDWNGDASAPYDMTLGEKREGNPIQWFGFAGFPAAAVESYALRASDPVGAHQQELRFTMRVSLVHKYASGETISQEMRELRGKIVENILGSWDDEARMWVGLDWISRIYLSAVQPRLNELEMFLRAKTLDLAGTGAGYTGAVMDFTVLCTMD